MKNIIKKKHQGKIWSLSHVNFVRDVYIKPGGIFDNVDSSTAKPVHLVFHLPYNYLRSGATSICEFKINDVTVPFIEMFCFYLHMVEGCYHADETKEDDHALFVENVRDKTNHCVAIRFHYYVNISDEGLKKVKEKILEENKKITKKLKKKYKKKNEEDTPIHKRYTSICNNYTWTKVASNYMMEPEVLDTTFNMPLRGDNVKNYTTFKDVFSMDSRIVEGYYIEDGMEKKADICENQCPSGTNGYFVDNYYTFPSTEDVIRVHPSQIFSIEIFQNKKYLLHYFMETVLLPKIIIRSKSDDSITITPGIEEFHVILPKKHVHEHVDLDNSAGTIHTFLSNLSGSMSVQIQIKKKLGVLHSVSSNATCYIFKSNNKEEKEKTIKKIKQTVREFYQVNEEIFYHPHATNNTLAGENESANQWFSIRNVYKSIEIGYLQWFTDSKILENDPIEKQALTTKNSLDTLDYLKYEGEIMKKKYPGTYKDYLLNAFKVEIVNNIYAIVSAPFRHILDWGESNKEHLVKRHKYRDWSKNNNDWEHENVFTNSTKWKMNFFDTDLQVSTGHATLMLLNHAKYDAYRQTQDLHMNIIFTGEGATSKSFLFEKMKQMSIPGTVVELTYQTAKSDAIDEDRNDTITVFNEAPPGLFMRNVHTDPNQEAMFKEKLTSQRVSCKTIVIDEETGLRTNRTTISSAIGVHLGATNDDPSDASEAMKTRFFWGQFEKNENKNKTMDECMQGEKKWNDIGESLLQNSLNDFHMEQFKVCILNKLMYIGAIIQPTLSTSDIIYQKICEYLRQEKLSTSTRFKERYDIMCRIYTMIHAIDIIFNFEMKENDMTRKCVICGNHAQYNESGKEAKFCIDCREANHVLYGNHYGKVFDVRQMKDVEPYLYCTEEIAIFTFTQISKEVYNPAEKKILTAIYNIWKQKKFNFKANKKDGYENLNDLDYNVAVFKIDNVRNLAKLIGMNIPIHIGRPSEHNIKCVLKDLQTRSIKHKKYVKYKTVSNTQSSDVYENIGNMSVERPEPMTPFVRGDMLCTHDSNETIMTDCLNIIDKDVEICIELFKEARIRESFKHKYICTKMLCNEEATYTTDSYPEFCVKCKPEYATLWEESPVIYSTLDNESILVKAIKNIQHKHTERKHILCGLPTYSENGQIQHPDHLHEMWITSYDKTIQVKNPLYKSKKEVHQRERTFLFEDEKYYGQEIEMDLNEVACLDHFDRLYKNLKLNAATKDDMRFIFMELYLLELQSKFKCIEKPNIEMEENVTFKFKYRQLKKRLAEKKAEINRKKQRLL